MIVPLARLQSRIKSRLQSLLSYARDPSGVAAVEFGLIVPLLAMLFLGAVEYSRATMFSRRFSQVTAMASDLIAREYLLDDADLEGVSRAIDTAWGGIAGIDNLQFEIKHVRRAGPLATKRAPGSSYVEWSFGIRTTGPNPPIPACQDYALPVANMIQPGNSVLIVTGRYTYTTLFGNVSVPLLGGETFALKNTFDWRSESSHAPRDLCVAYNKPNCISTCE